MNSGEGRDTTGGGNGLPDVVEKDIKSPDIHIAISELPSSDGKEKEDMEQASDRGMENEAEEATERGSWGNKLGFILTCISFSVGLGNVWRFPYLCYKNGGGAFLLPFIILLALVGMPLFFMELSFGQFASLGPISIWKINPLFKGLGYGMVAVSWLIAVYYNVVISHVMLYLIKSIGSLVFGLPWVTCGNTWNSDECREQRYHNDSDNNSTFSITTATERMTTSLITVNGTMIESNATIKWNTPASANATIKWNTPAEEYFNYYVLERSEGIDDPSYINWKLALCLLLSWTIVLVCLIRGIKSMGKIVYFTALFPYVMLTILLVRGLTLPGAMDGIIFYIKPDFEKLKSISVWSDAATQIFYSLSCCCGGLIAMASYNDFHYNCLRDSLIVPIINCLTSVFAGFVIFAILGFMAHEKGVDVKDVATGGPGLAFVVYPEALSRMPLPQLWAILFFFMMANLGFGSEFSLVECVLSAVTDEFPGILRKKWNSYIFRTIVILCTFLLGLPMVTNNGIYLLNLVDNSVSGFPMLFIGFFEIMAIVWVYGFKAFSSDINLMLGIKPNYFWEICWMFVTPAIILGLIFCGIIFYHTPTMGDYHYPNWAVALGWLISLFPMLLLPLYCIYYWCRHGGFQLCVNHLQPIEQWGPALRENREGTRYGSQAVANEEMLPNTDNDNALVSEEDEFLTKPSTTQVKFKPTVVRTNSPPNGESMNHINTYPVQVTNGCANNAAHKNGTYLQQVAYDKILQPKLNDNYLDGAAQVENIA